jgi:hypothetical protein
MTRAAAIAASEAGHGYKPVSNAPGDGAFQIQVGSGYDRLQPLAAGQKVIDVPFSGAACTSHHRSMPIQALETARAPGRAGVGIESLCEMDPSQRANCNLLCLGQAQDQGINSGLASMLLHMIDIK